MEKITFSQWVIRSGKTQREIAREVGISTAACSKAYRGLQSGRKVARRLASYTGLPVTVFMIPDDFSSPRD
ncbi:hypothetical protein [Laribacter hongkongensis]|uniref:hypothetical protein n=1 Tax=Laribacter hongkongensis TaxID=168471 RepID=UPI0005597B3F|nr:hypothetical protein [Laribacter hongkongensis]